jgi:nitrate reductase gamma subunit
MFLVGLLVGLALVALALYLHLPKLLILILSAFAGAATLLAGIFLALGRISLDNLRFSEIGALLRDSWFWGLLFLAIAALGFYFQWRTTQTYFLQEYTSENPFTSVGTSATGAAAPGAPVA